MYRRRADRLSALMAARRNIFIRLAGVESRYALVSATNVMLTIHVGVWARGEFQAHETHRLPADSNVFDGYGWNLERVKDLITVVAQPGTLGQEQETMNLSEQILQQLQPFRLKQEADGKYRCNNPWRPGASGMTFTLKIDASGSGAYYDHKDGEGGSLIRLARKLGIEVPRGIEVKETKRSYNGMDDYARAHGLTAAYLDIWHWRETTHQGRHALLIPTRTGDRYRFLDGAPGKPNYTSPSGYKRCWYGLSEDVTNDLRSGKPLVICNGEISTIAGQRYGLAAVCVTAGEKAEIPQDLLEQLKGKLSEVQSPRIIIAMDCDETGRKAARGLERQLKEAGLNAVAVDLDLGRGGDLADFCMLWGDDSAARLLELSTLPPEIGDTPDRLWRVVTIKEILNAKPISWLVPRMIPESGLSVIYGESGTYKSFFTLHLALSIAQTKPVIYVAAEGESGYKQRLEAWFKHHGKYTEKLTFVMGSMSLFDDADLHEFSVMAEKYKPVMIVIDTLSMSIGEADTNNGRDMVLVFQHCKRIINALNCAIVLVHHTNAEGRRATGSQRIKDSVDTMIRLSREDDAILVESKKSKDAQPFEAFRLKEVEVDLGYTNNLGEKVSSLVLLPDAKVQRTSSITDVQRRILEQVELDSAQSFAEIADALEISRSSVSSAVGKLMKKQHLQREGECLVLTQAGRDVLEFDSTDSIDSTDSTHSPVHALMNMAESPESAESAESESQPHLPMQLPPAKPTENQYTNGY